MESLGLLHLYYGDGKGKTPAAMGLEMGNLPPQWGMDCWEPWPGKR